MPRWCRSAWVVVSMLAFAAVAAASEEDPAWKLAAHGGWWDVGVDTTTPGGLFAGLGVPWVPLLPVLAYSGQEGVVALDSRLAGLSHLGAEISTVRS